jgi:hypothetical protein
VLQTYADVTLAAHPYPASGSGAGSGAGPSMGPLWRRPDYVHDALLLHCLNHVAKTADRIKKNNERLEAAAGTSATDVPRDQVGGGGHQALGAWVSCPISDHG